MDIDINIRTYRLSFRFLFDRSVVDRDGTEHKLLAASLRTLATKNGYWKNWRKGNGKEQMSADSL